MSPTFEMFKFYLAGQRVRILNAPAIANVNNGSSLVGTVPAGKCWVIEAIVANSSVLGGVANVYAWLTIGSVSAGSTMIIGQPSPLGLPGQALQMTIKGPEIMVAGDFITIFSSAPGAVTAFNWNVNVYGIEVSA